jgi:hypothetical protein
MIKAALLLLITASMAMADDRMGCDTHFDQDAGTNYGPSFLPEMITTTPAISWIRDDGNWALDELSPGVYAEYPTKQQWIDAVHSQGLKTVWILEQVPTFYGTASLGFPAATNTAAWAKLIPAAANFCAWLAKTEGPEIAAIEVTNEPNNAFASQVGTGWQSLLVQLTTAVHDAVHAVSPNTAVIGYGAQGADVLAMLKQSQDLDGVVYHPYFNGLSDDIPESVYESSTYTNYQAWVNTVKAATNLPIWETEWAANGGDNEEWAAISIGRRLPMAFWNGIKHTFYYEFCSQDTSQAITDYNQLPREQYYVIDRICAELTPDLLPDTHTPTATSADPNFDAPNFMAFNFANGSGTTVAAEWHGNVKDPGTIGWSPTANGIQQCSLTVYHPAPTGTVIATDVLSGESWAPTWTQSGNNVVIAGQVQQSTIMYKITATGGSTSTAPTVVQTGRNAYGAASIGGLSVVFSKPELVGNSITVSITHSSAQSVSGVWDLTKNVYKQTSTSTLNNITTEVWTASPIVACGYDNVTGVTFSAATFSPSITVTEVTQ